MTVRLAHFSDIHVTASPLGWELHDWLTKRVTGWMNTHCGSRRWRFARVDEVLSLLVADVRARGPDAVVFSGDATMLGFPGELARAAALLGLSDAKVAGFAVPGNHDYYITRAESSGAFERTFAPWLAGQRVGEAPYPFARPVGHVWLVGVCAAVANWIPWDARGRVGVSQLQRLRQLLAGLPPGPRILVTHYPVADANGAPEDERHCLRDLSDLLAVATAGGVGLWLHGHRHDWYVLQPNAGRPFPVICAGSATEAKRWGYLEYTITGTTLHGLRRAFDGERRVFQDEQTFTLELPVA